MYLYQVLKTSPIDSYVITRTIYEPAGKIRYYIYSAYKLFYVFQICMRSKISRVKILPTSHISGGDIAIRNDSSVKIINMNVHVYRLWQCFFYTYVCVCVCVCVSNCIHSTCMTQTVSQTALFTYYVSLVSKTYTEWIRERKILRTLHMYYVRICNKVRRLHFQFCDHQLAAIDRPEEKISKNFSFPRSFIFYTQYLTYVLISSYQCYHC